MTAAAPSSAEAPRSTPPRALEPPVISVVVLSYNSRRRIDTALRSLGEQQFSEPFEIIVVDSGEDGCSDYVRRAYPSVRVAPAGRRLWPGGARNRGIALARGDYVAFLADDCAAAPDWLQRRVDKHRQGFDAVGGAVTNGTPFHPVGSADYYIEYSAMIPSERALGEQAVPHSLSYHRSVFERFGGFPEDTRTGEDTLFNGRILEAGVAVGLDAEVKLAHCNLKRLRPFLRHHFVHGRGLMHCVGRHGYESRVGPLEQRAAAALIRIFVRYPVIRWWSALRRIAGGRPRLVAGYLAIAPLVWAGLFATSAGAFSEWRALRNG